MSPLLEPGHPDRAALHDPEIVAWVADGEAARILAAVHAPRPCIPCDGADNPCPDYCGTCGGKWPCPAADGDAA